MGRLKINNELEDLKNEYEKGFGGMKKVFSPDEMKERGIGTDKKLIYSLNEDLEIPINYIISKEGIYKKKYDKDDNPVVVKISENMIIPTASIYYLDDDKIDIEVSYYESGEWKKEYVERRTLLDKNRILELNNLGLNISSLNANEIVIYFYDFLVNNPNLRIKKITNKLGWIQNHTGYVPIRNNGVELSNDKGFRNMIEGFKCHGTIEDWVEEMEDYRNNLYFRFILSARICRTISGYCTL